MTCSVYLWDEYCHLQCSQKSPTKITRYLSPSIITILPLMMFFEIITEYLQKKRSRNGWKSWNNMPKWNTNKVKTKIPGGYGVLFAIWFGFLCPKLQTSLAMLKVLSTEYVGETGLMEFSSGSWKILALFPPYCSMIFWHTNLKFRAWQSLF